MISPKGKVLDMLKQFHTPMHRELTPEEELKLLHLEEMIEKSEKTAPERMKPHLDTFNDGVIAIIITIMVLELPVPAGPGAYPVFLKQIGLFLVSFFIVAGFWYEHHRILSVVQKADHQIVILDLLFLATLSLIPVMTKWILVERNSWSVVAYGTAYLAVSICLGLLEFAALKERFRGFRELYLYMFVSRMGIELALSAVMIILGWNYPKFAMPCYLVFPLLAFLHPKKRRIRMNGGGIIRSVTFENAAEGAADNSLEKEDRT